MFREIGRRIFLFAFFSLLMVIAPEPGFGQKGDQPATGPGDDATSTVITATGSLEPEETIDVNAKVTGEVKAFGKDADGKTVDRRSEVEKGAVLAIIDDSLYANEVAQAQAQLEIAQAEARQAQGKQPLDAPTVDRAKAAVKLAQAVLDRAKMNLDNCTIRSPIKGEVIDRRVNLGQTVTSVPSAPSCFLIARDLTRMQIWVSVNEADIGNVHTGQIVTYTVDARHGKTFRGTVAKVRFDATMTKNVVTYTVEVTAPNPDRLLFPYMTANVKFEPAGGK